MEKMFQQGTKAVARLDETIEESQPGIYRSIEASEQATKNSAEAMAELDRVLQTFDEQLLELENLSEVIESYDLDGGNEISQMVESLNASSTSLAKFLSAFEKSPIKTM